MDLVCAYHSITHAKAVGDEVQVEFMHETDRHRVLGTIAAGGRLWGTLCRKVGQLPSVMPIELVGSSVPLWLPTRPCTIEITGFMLEGP